MGGLNIVIERKAVFKDSYSSKKNYLSQGMMKVAH